MPSLLGSKTTLCNIPSTERVLARSQEFPLFFMYRSNWSFNIPPGIPRAYPGHMTLQCAREAGNLNVALEGRGGEEGAIWTALSSCSGVIFPWVFSVLQGLTIYKIEVCLCYWLTLSKGSSKEVWRCHHDISLSEKCEQCLIEDEICLWGRGISELMVGAFERLFCPEGREFEQANLQKLKCPGACPWGRWSFNLTGTLGDCKVICCKLLTSIYIWRFKRVIMVNILHQGNFKNIMVYSSAFTCRLVLILRWSINGSSCYEFSTKQVFCLKVFPRKLAFPN